MRTDSTENHPAPIQILLVEDDLVVQDLVVEILEDEGYAVITTVTPVEAATLLTHVAFDLVITDGFGTAPSALFTSTRALLEAAGTTPVALFSAHRVPLEDAQVAGFRAVLDKPFELTTLLGHVRHLLDR